MWYWGSNLGWLHPRLHLGLTTVLSVWPLLRSTIVLDHPTSNMNLNIPSSVLCPFQSVCQVYVGTSVLRKSHKSLRVLEHESRFKFTMIETSLVFIPRAQCWFSNFRVPMAEDDFHPLRAQPRSSGSPETAKIHHWSQPQANNLLCGW